MPIFAAQTKPILKRFLTILRRTILFIIAILFLAYVAIQTDYVQNWLKEIATGKLSKALGTEVKIKKVSISFFNRVNMEGTLVRDKQKDTLLYAGLLKVRMTDWFFLKDKVVLHFVGIEDAVIKIQRTDSVWNYGFIADYFSSPNPSKKSKGIDLNIKKLDFTNIRFQKNDRWVGERMDLTLGSFILDAENIDLNKMAFDINRIALEKPVFKIQGFTALRPKKVPAAKKEKDTGMYFNAADLYMRVADLSIRNGTVFIDGNEEKPIRNFDGSHIQLTKLNGNLSNVSFVKDTMRANISLSVKDRCGLEIKKLKTNFRFTPQIMELANLDLQTAKSRLTNYYAMQYKDFNEDFGDYINKVIMNAQFKESRINSDDIAYFAPELTTWKKNILFGGKFLGTVEDFNIKNLYARTTGGTNISGDLRMKGLPEINTTKINFTNGTVQTNANEMGIVIPAIRSLKSPNLAALGTIIYRGNFIGTVNDFRTAGNFSTKIGGLKTDISLTMPKKGEPTYKGNIETIRFHLGKFLDEAKLGLVDFKGSINGSSFILDKLKTTLTGNISSLEYNEYKYRNITTNGTLQKRYFSGEIKIDDPNLDFTSTLEVDLKKDAPRFNILGDLIHSNLDSLNILRNGKSPIKLSGFLDVNFTGTTIDNFEGVAKFLNANLSNDESKLSFDSLNLVSELKDSIKTLHLGSNDFSVNVSGKFSIKDLPESFQSFLTQYYPAYIKPIKTIPKNQVFSFNASTGYIEPYLKFIDKKLSGFNDVKMNGSINTITNQLLIDANIPSGRYEKISIIGLDIIGKGNRDSLSINGTISSTQVTDSMRFPNTRINIVSRNDHSVVSLKTSADNTLTDAELNADIYTLTNGARIAFMPSSFVLNEKKWQIEKSGELTIRKQLIEAHNIKLTEGFQEISITNLESTNNKTGNLAVNLKDVSLGDLTALFFKDPRLEGITSGTVELQDLLGDFTALANLKTEQFRLNNDSIGQVIIHAEFDKKTGEIPFSIQSPNEGYQFSAKGKYNIKDSTDQAFSTDIHLDNSKIDILHMFLSNLFSDISGFATGDLRISGDLNAPDLFGQIALRKAGMKVNYTQVYYTIDSADIKFKEEGIDFGKFNVQDRFKNTGTIIGSLKEKGFKNLFFDFELSTDKLLLIDTKATDNQQFYGNAIGNAKLKLYGPETAAKLNIRAEANDSSHIYIPNSINRESGEADFIVFKKYGTEILQSKSSSNFNLIVDLDITADKRVQIDVILDQLTGDVIKAVGNGKLKIHAGSTEPLTINGRYNIEKGNYIFNFQGLLRKPFELLPEAGNYIEWTGDPFRADLHIDAQYTAERISLTDLVSKMEMSPQVKGYRGDVYVIAQLREKLNKPEIRFKLDFPQGSPVKTDAVFTSYLNRLEKDQNEILNQVAFLILFNSFAPPGGGGTGAGITPYSITSITVNSISQVLTKSVNKALSNLLYKITGDRSLRFDIGTTVYSSSSLMDPGSTGINTQESKLDRTRVDLKLGYAFANDKVIVTLGSDFDFSLGNSSAIQNGNTQWLPNVNIEIVLSQDKRLRLIIFNRNSLDFTGSSFGRRTRQGVSISYRKEFESFFGRKENELELKTPADSTLQK